MSPLSTAGLAQVLGAVIAASLIQVVQPKLFSAPLAVAAIQGACAAVVSAKLGAPKWWLGIHLGFLPAALWLTRLGQDLGVAPIWYFAGFAALLLIFWRTDRGQVPLYLSNAATAEALAAALPDAPCQVIDLGCGDGGLLRRLAAKRPDCDFVGVEHAPLPWLWAKLAGLGRTNLEIRYGDFWRLRLGRFDLVYAFLSPAPMPRLIAKARAEMRPGTLLVANSFAVPEVVPERVIEVDDRRATRLHCYRMGTGTR
ncbi:MAG TPA: class I SAM-dependent methyltransferase [Rhodocyclaceae bacterium]|nr:class I SAM-dependent methyltransferase [Rhodocyclaceae bacterium]